jgi:hypothetical protein
VISVAEYPGDVAFDTCMLSFNATGIASIIGCWVNSLRSEMGHLTIALALWGATGPLIGILVGHHLTRSWQREQWRRDNRKQEYRELLSCLSNAYTHMVRFGSGHGWPDEIHQRVEEVKTESFRVLRDRIFIAEEIKKSGIMELWAKVFHSFGTFGQSGLLDPSEFEDLIRQIVTLAITDPADSSLWKRLRTALDDDDAV